MGSSRYRIVLRGRLSERFESAFDGMAMEAGPNQTVLVGEVRDQAQLYGLLDRLRDFGIELLAVEPAGPPDAGAEGGLPSPPAGERKAQSARRLGPAPGLDTDTTGDGPPNHQ
jgi:hypothetical protein